MFFVKLCFHALLLFVSIVYFGITVHKASLISFYLGALFLLSGGQTVRLDSSD